MALIIESSLNCLSTSCNVEMGDRKRMAMVISFHNIMDHHNLPNFHDAHDADCQCRNSHKLLEVS